MEPTIVNSFSSIKFLLHADLLFSKLLQRAFYCNQISWIEISMLTLIKNHCDEIEETAYKTDKLHLRDQVGMAAIFFIP